MAEPVSKRCYVDRVRFCRRCEQPVDVNHKYQWKPTPIVGVYSLEHRDCAQPSKYPETP